MADRLPAIRRLPAAKQRRMDLLLDNNREGIITEREPAAWRRPVREAEELLFASSQRLADFSETARGAIPSNAIRHS